ncbi:hypothetical protein ACRE_001480 [Hapsidospora chrysogenum ATCC 11550]|uniref:Uncharacterized protein n=1 Tax=Hapsidospora chrysogenum (strain ATCC 11550 / CBS 779.69 / DSM 880 / IAM 14645 / JCM 23072 / IMI 49137) TaxID=857340 RepID=A0A086TIA1_HAPC1|nr:hypothetical protein ACRE_001480 [Hapsidospora chrysogenum ATCC 11550]
MASLSRGLFHPNMRTQLLRRPRAVTNHSELSSLSLPRLRLFTTSPFRLRVAQPKTASTPPSTKATKPPSSPPQTSYALIKSLATKPTPTVLYEGPSNFWFYFGCWSSGLSILTWTAVTGPLVLFTEPAAPEGAQSLPEWVTWINGSSYVLLAAMGFYLISKTPNIVKTIRVLPAPAKLRPAPLATPTAAPATAPPTTTLQMEVTVHRMLPFLKPKVLVQPLDRVSIKSRLSLPEEYVPELRRLQLERMERQREAEQRKYDMEHLLTMPIRRLARGMMGLFNGVRSAWTDMGFGVIRVDGKEYKVNVTKGFAHDGFRTLEKIVSVKAK